MNKDVIFYSASLGGFLFNSDRPAYEIGIGWPEDAIEISGVWYNYLIDGQKKGREIVSNEYGQPVLCKVEVDHKALLELQKKELLKIADSVTMIWRTELALGTISDADKTKLIEWINYYKAVEATNTDSPDSVFPAQPSK